MGPAVTWLRCHPGCVTWQPGSINSFSWRNPLALLLTVISLPCCHCCVATVSLAESKNNETVLQRQDSMQKALIHIHASLRCPMARKSSRFAFQIHKMKNRNANKCASLPRRLCWFSYVCISIYSASYMLYVVKY